jgi:hypothetical protein
MKLRELVASLLLAFSFTAQAIPITYDFELVGGFGAGSFVYDADTPTLSDFNISLDEFFFGALDLSVLPESDEFSNLLFEILTGENAHPASCTDPDGACVFNTFDLEFLFQLGFERTGDEARLAFFDLNTGDVFISDFTAQRRAVAVAEPAALYLVGLGLLALGLIVRLLPHHPVSSLGHPLAAGEGNQDRTVMN